FCTSGSAFSFTKTPAVVCATEIAQIPSRIFERVTAAFTRDVMSTVSWVFDVSTESCSCLTVISRSSQGPGPLQPPFHRRLRQFIAGGGPPATPFQRRLRRFIAGGGPPATPLSTPASPVHRRG